MRGKWARSALLAGGLLLLPGCWDQQPIENRAVAIAAAVSRKDQWSFIFPNVAVTVNNLGQIPPAQEFYTVTVRAHTWPEAMERLETQMSRQVSFGELQLLVVDRRLTHEALTRIIDDMNTDGSIPATFWVAAADHPLAVLDLTSPQSIVPYYLLAQYFDCTTCHPWALGVHAWQWWADDGTPGDTPFLPLIEAQGATFVIDKLLLYPTPGVPVVAPPSITEALAYLLGKVHAGVLSVTVNGMRFELDRMEASSRASARLAPDAVRVRVVLAVNGNIGDAPAHAVLSQQIERAIDRAAARTLHARLAQAVLWTNRHHADPYGYAKRAAWRDSEQAERLTPETLGELPIEATIRVRVRVQGEGVMR
ncbi:MAG: spore gernimation protein [Firmicutes bacterium]|nr:spore gernimation protein [Bacillota bacterium]